MIRKYYARSIVALLLIPPTGMAAAALSFAIDPELARGHRDYVRLYALIQAVSNGVRFAGLALVVLLWMLGCDWLLRAKGRGRAWLPLALLGPLGFVVLALLPDRSVAAGQAAVGGKPDGLARAWRILFEVLRFVGFGFLSLQLVEWQDQATALLEASRRGLPLAQVLAERDASSGMWAFGDLMRAALWFVLMYALWPAACRLAARLRR